MKALSIEWRCLRGFVWIHDLIGIRGPHVDYLKVGKSMCNKTRIQFTANAMYVSTLAN